MAFSLRRKPIASTPVVVLAEAKPDLSNRGAEADAATMVYAGGSVYSSLGTVEYNPELAGLEGIRTYDKMRRGDAQVRESLKMVKSPILTAQYYVEPASDSDQDLEIAELVEWNFIEHLNRPFTTFVREALSFLDFGYYMFEKLWEIAEWTPQPNDRHPKPRSRTVALWRDFKPRHPIKVGGFYFANAELDHVAYGATSANIPASKLIRFILDQEADDPQGMSILRSAYKHWWYKENFYRVDGIQKERHGVGIPAAKMPPGATPQDKASMEELLGNLRANETAFALLPPGWEVYFMKPEGQLVDVLSSAVHHGLMILQNVLVQFLALGTQESGSRAVSSTQSDAFSQSVRYVLDYQLGVMNHYVIPEMVDFNYMGVTSYPKLKARVIGDEAKIRALASGLQMLVDTGLLTPEPEIEAWLREFSGMPRMTADAAKRGIKDRIGPLPKGVTERINDAVTQTTPGVTAPTGSTPAPAPSGGA